MLSGALEEFSITYQLFEEIKRFESSFYRIEVQVFTNSSNQIEKHQTLDFLLMTTFMFFFKKNLNSAFFRYFRKTSAVHTKIVACVVFNVTMLDQTQYSLINPFSNDIFQYLCPLPV